jgi:pimeloyl-ACP methyl ester carboxylesterase
MDASLPLLKVHRYGDVDRPVLLIIHGLFGMGINWHSIAQRCAERYQVVVPDLRNHGKSFHHPFMDIPTMAGDMVALLNSLGIAQADVMGHSLGAKVALELAMSHPAMVQKLVLVDMTHAPVSPRHHELFEAMRGLQPQRFSKRSELDTALAHGVPNQKIRLFLLKNIHRNADGHFDWMLNLAALEHNYPNLGAAVALSAQPQREALLVRGAKSTYVTDAAVEQLKGFLPKLQTISYPDAGHWVHAEVGERFVEDVLRFLGS